MEMLKRLNLAIVDDNQKFLYLLKEKLQGFGCRKIACFESLKDFSRMTPDTDLLVCDICLAEGQKGFDAIYKEKIRVPVLFVSAFGCYMRDSFGPNVVGFVEKGKLDEQLLPALSRALRFLEGKKRILFQTFHTATEFCEEKIESIVMSDNGVVLSLTGSGEEVILTERSLAACMKKLDRVLFFRINKSTIIQLAAVLDVDETDHALQMYSGKTYKVSRRNWKDFYGRWIWKQ